MVSFPNAKINLGLHVTERRPDGYHNIETLFYPVRLADALEILPSDAFNFQSSGIEISTQSHMNLVVKAYHLLQSAFSLPPVRIYLHKVIPPGAGLGGGSADASFTLVMLNNLFKIGLPRQQLENFAGMLGADCPFFVFNKPALASGKGDQLMPVDTDLSGYKIVLVKPPVSVNTAQAYQLLTPHKSETPLSVIVSQPVTTWKARLLNDFEKPVFTLFPEISAVKQKLYDLGAHYASMSGSGSVVFGLFKEIPVNLKNFFPPAYSVFNA
jgi:4-diphosphocytidyl-2-C-methyl-D-erythritol kinase